MSFASQVIQLEDRIAQKDKLLSDMTNFQRDLYKSLEEAQSELSNLRNTREAKDLQAEETSRKMDAMSQKILDLESQHNVLSSQSDQYKQEAASKANYIR